MSPDAGLTTIADFARRQAGAQPDKIAFKFEGEEITFAEFDANANRTANALVDFGLKPGDRIGGEWYPTVWRRSATVYAHR